MLVQQRINKGRTYCICKNQFQNSVFQSSVNLNFENSFKGPTMVGPIVDSGYKRSSIFSVNST